MRIKKVKRKKLVAKGVTIYPEQAKFVTMLGGGYFSKGMRMLIEKEMVKASESKK